MTRTELLTAYSAGNRLFIGANLFGAKLFCADLRRADLRRADLSAADLSRANLSGAYLIGAYLIGANLSRADLYGADLSGADLSGADLSRANLSGANLSGAYLSGANLSRADLSDAIMPTGIWWIQGGTRSDGYAFAFAKLDAGGPALIRAGCRTFTPAEAVAHWTATRGGTPLGDESLMLVKQLVELAALRGLGE